jgi:cytoskeletal protein CcmA (bactofilin family)
LVNALGIFHVIYKKIFMKGKLKLENDLKIYGEFTEKN